MQNSIVANPAIPPPLDYDTSLVILVEREPTFLSCLNIMNSLCLGNGVQCSIRFSKPSKNFEMFFAQYFVSILNYVQKYKLFCGFLPFVLKKLPKSNNTIPVILPIGSFTWHTELVSVQEKNNKRVNRTFDQNTVARYFCNPSNDVGIGPEDVYIVNLVEPTCCFQRRCSIGQILFSPLFTVVKTFIELEVAREQISYANDWNCTARLVTCNKPPQRMNEAPGYTNIPFGANKFEQAQMEEGFFSYENQKIRWNNVSEMARNALERNDFLSGSRHVPSSYHLPMHHDLTNTPHLQPIVNVKELEDSFHVKVAHVFGVPVQLMGTDHGKISGMDSDKLPLISELMATSCRDLSALHYKSLLAMYTAVYQPKSSVYDQSIRFKFDVRNLYSEEIKERENELLELQHPTKPNPTKKSKG